MNTVYTAFERKVVFEGTEEECRNWLLDQGFHMPNGSVVYRTWEEDGDKFWDMDGNVYIFNEKTSC